MDTAQERAAVAVQNLPANKKALKKARRRQRGRRFLAFTVISAAAGAAVVAWRKQNAKQDPWTPDPAVTTVNGAANGSALTTPTTPVVPVEDTESDPIIGDARTDR